MNERIDRRSFIGRGAVTAASLAAAAGAGGVAGSLFEGLAGAVPAPGITNGPGRNGISNAKPRRGGSITVGTDAEVQGFDPSANEWDENGYLYGRTVFDPLMAVTNTGKVVPYLAQSLVPNSTFTSWTVTLRPGLRFSDGTPCDAAALMVNLQKQSTSILTGPVFSQFVKSYTQTGPLSVRLDMTSPWASFPYTISSASQVGYVAAPSMLNNPNGSSHPIGTGPFVFDSWIPNESFKARRNPNYWRSGMPYLDSITFKPIVDDSARSQALQSGTVDLIISFDPEVILQYRGHRQWSYVDDSGAVVGEPQVECIQLNCSQPPFDDQTARLALATSFSQAQFTKVISLGVSKPQTSPFAPGSAYYRPTTYPSFNLARARRAVKAYQQKHGKPLSFTLTYIPNPRVQQAATYLQQRWENVGMKVGLNVIQQNTLIANAVSGKYQAVTWRQFGVVDPDLNYVFWSTQTVKKTGLSLNIARNFDPRIQTALTTGRQNPNQAVRTKAYSSIGEYMAQDLPYIWLGRAVWTLIANPKVQNFNNPSAPNGSKLIGNDNGTFWPTTIWVS